MKEREVSLSAWCNLRNTPLAIAGFEDEGREPWAKECGKPLEDEKHKAMDPPLEPPERNLDLLALILAQWDLCQTSDL